MRFIELTSYNDQDKVYVNVSSIESVYKIKAKGFHSPDWECTVVTTSASTLRVTEPIEEVMRMIYDVRY